MVCIVKNIFIIGCALLFCVIAQAQTVTTNAFKKDGKFYYIEDNYFLFEHEVRPGRKTPDFTMFPLYVLLQNNKENLLRKQTDTITIIVSVNGHCDTFDLTLDNDLVPDSLDLLAVPLKMHYDVLKNSCYFMDVETVRGMEDNWLCTKVIRLNGDSVSDNWLCNKFQVCIRDIYAYDFYEISPSKDTLFYLAENIYDIHQIAYAILVGPNSFLPRNATDIWAGYQKPVDELIVPRLVECYSLYFGPMIVPVTSIHSATFKDCDSVTSVDLPSSIEAIGGGAFKGCTRLTSVTVRSKTPPSIYSTTFAGVDSNCTLLVPCSALADYQSSEYWSRFRQIEGFFDYKLTAVPKYDYLGSVEIVRKPVCGYPLAVIKAVPNEGYRFKQWENGERTNPRTVTVTSDTVLTAYFQTVDVEEPTEPVPMIHSENGVIMITNLQQQETIEVCNLLGQVCFKGKAQDVLAVPVSTSGLYFVRIGKNLVRKVAVFKN